MVHRHRVGISQLVPLLLVVVLFRPNDGTMIAVLGLTGWPFVARLVRGDVLAVWEREYVESARSGGAMPGRLMRRHLLPNVMGTVVVSVSGQVSTTLMVLATASFLGYGLTPPDPNWAGMVASSRQYLYDNRWWLLWMPRATFVLLQLAVNFVADALRQASDPKSAEVSLMLTYVGQRVVQALFAFVGIATVIFFVLHLDAASPARAELGLRASQKVINHLNAELGLNQPLPLKFWDWFLSTFLGGGLLLQWLRFLPRTLELAALGIGLAFASAVGLASWQVQHPNTWGDHLLTAELYVLNATPAFWLSLLLVWELALNLLILPPNGVPSATHVGFWQWGVHMIMPVATVYAAAVGGWTRYLRASLEESLETDFVRTARAKGADEHRVLCWHALRNSLLPLASTSFPVLINTVIVAGRGGRAERRGGRHELSAGGPAHSVPIADRSERPRAPPRLTTGRVRR